MALFFAAGGRSLAAQRLQGFSWFRNHRAAR